MGGVVTLKATEPGGLLENSFVTQLLRLYFALTICSELKSPPFFEWWVAAKKILLREYFMMWIYYSCVCVFDKAYSKKALSA